MKMYHTKLQQNKRDIGKEFENNNKPADVEEPLGEEKDGV